MKDKWKKLLCPMREREYRSGSYDKGRPIQNSNNDVVVRNAFEADYDRIVGSSSVRRLQDKAQVYPLQKNDFTRTRLTHSIEVSAMARSMGKAVGRQLERKDIFDGEMTDELSAILQTAGLIHDLGNPPFGHYGETVIRNFFREWFIKYSHRCGLTDEQQKDFEFFDGNVQNLRIVSRLQTMNDQFGANFTFATLATIIKYPFSSREAFDKYAGTYKVKYGYYQSEKDLYDIICKELGIEHGKRYPATYLLEAADDIIYICDDIEDGVKKGYIPWDTVYNELKQDLPQLEEDIWSEIYNKKTDDRIEANEQLMAKVRTFRNAVQVYLFKKAVSEFVDNHDEIVLGEYRKEDLLKCEEELVEKIKKITKKYCYGCREVLALEVVGERVLRELLSIIVKALTRDEVDNKKEDEYYLSYIGCYEGKIYEMISPNFKYIAQYGSGKTTNSVEEISLYDRLHLATDFVSGMTDSYAVRLYRELTGIEIPLI